MVRPSTEVLQYRSLLVPRSAGTEVQLTGPSRYGDSRCRDSALPAKFPTSNPVRRGRRRPPRSTTNERLQLGKVGRFSPYGSGRPVGPWSVAMLALVALVVSLGAVSTAAADDCVTLGGFINAALE